MEGPLGTTSPLSLKMSPPLSPGPLFGGGDGMDTVLESIVIVPV